MRLQRGVSGANIHRFTSCSDAVPLYRSINVKMENASAREKYEKYSGLLGSDFAVVEGSLMLKLVKETSTRPRRDKKSTKTGSMQIPTTSELVSSKRTSPEREQKVANSKSTTLVRVRGIAFNKLLWRV